MKKVKVDVTCGTDTVIRFAFPSMHGLEIARFDDGKTCGERTMSLFEAIGCVTDVTDIRIQVNGATVHRAILAVTWRRGLPMNDMGKRLWRIVEHELKDVELGVAFWNVNPARRW